MVMNASCIIDEMELEGALPDLAADEPACDTPAAQRPQERGRISSEELARKVLKLTGSVRLVSRSAYHWHHCGINE
jgi:hypothetical protein